MITVKVSSPFDWPLERQTPGGRGVWGNCRFVVNQEIEECDFWVVLEGVKITERVRCPRENTLLITCEPPDVKSYSREFLAQFKAVITCNRNLPHPNLLFTQQGLPWMIGAELDVETLTWNNFKSFEELSRPVPKKSKLLSVVLSRKRITPGHIARERFIQMLIDELGEAVDVFGIGYSPLRDKWDAIAPYRYHLVIENSRVPDYWSEKLADAFIGEAFPLYVGCPNIFDYFSGRSIEIIDIGSGNCAIEKVKKIISSDQDCRRRNDLLKEKQAILREYNLFALISHLLDSSSSFKGKNVSLSIHPDQNFTSKIGRFKQLLKKFFAEVNGVFV